MPLKDAKHKQPWERVCQFNVSNYEVLSWMNLSGFTNWENDRLKLS